MAGTVTVEGQFTDWHWRQVDAIAQRVFERLVREEMQRQMDERIKREREANAACDEEK